MAAQPEGQKGQAAREVRPGDQKKRREDERSAIKVNPQDAKKQAGQKVPDQAG